MSNDLIRLTAADLAAKLASGEVSSVEATQAHLDRIAAVDADIHAFLHVSDHALEVAADIDRRRAAGESLGPVAGVPLAIKDVLVTTDMPSTSGSRILEGYMSPFDATVVARSRAAGLVPLGKTNMDEFAMGSSTEHSAYGPTHNPWDLDRDPRRFGRRLRGCRRRVRGAARARLRHGRLDPPARPRDRHGRPQADVRRRQPVRRDRPRLESRPGRPGHPHRARRGSAARRHRRSRPARLDVADRRLALLRRRRPRGCPRRRAARASGRRHHASCPTPASRPGVSASFRAALWPRWRHRVPRSSRSARPTSSTASPRTT